MDIYESMVKQCSIINFVIDSTYAVIDTNLYTMTLLGIYDVVGREFFSFFDDAGQKRIKSCLSDENSEPMEVNLLDAGNNLIPAVIVFNRVGGYLVAFGIIDMEKKNICTWNNISDIPIANSSELNMDEKGSWQQNYVDDTTGLYNMKFFEKILSKKFEEANDTGNNLGIMIINIDGFKELEQKYGENKAKSVLAGLSQVILASIRNTDYAIRYGDQKILLLLGTVKEKFLPVIGERIKEGAVAQIGVTISIGCTSMATSGRENKDNLVANAEKALEVSKSQGPGSINVI